MPVVLLQVVDQTQTVDLAVNFVAVVEKSPLVLPLLLILEILDPGRLLFNFLVLAHTQQQRVVHDILRTQQRDVPPDLLDKLLFPVRRHHQEGVVGFQVVDVLQHGGVGVLHVALDGGALQVVPPVQDAVLLEYLQGVLHHDEVDLGDASDLDREQAVGATD